jgi:hypothetical protein
VEVYKPICARVPQANRALLATLCDFCNRFVVPFVDLNKMTHSNLSVVFGPVFCWRANLSPMEELANASRVNGLVKEIIEAADQLFPGCVVPIPGVPPLSKSASASAPLKVEGLSPPAAESVPRTPVSARKDAAEVVASPGPKRPLFLGSQRSLPTAAPPAPPSTSPPPAAPAAEPEPDGPQKPHKPLPLIPRSALTASTPASLARADNVDEDEEEEEDAEDDK